MHATVYGRGQMVIPARARKEAPIETGNVVSVLPEGDGRLVLVRMERPKPKPRNNVRIIRRKGKYSLLSIGQPISREEVFKALEQFHRDTPLPVYSRRFFTSKSRRAIE